jgi:transposase
MPTEQTTRDKDRRLRLLGGQPEPEVLTVEEAAAVLRIGRGAAYALARRWRATGGAEGLPVIVLGRSLRVPRRELERLLAPGSVGSERHTA